MHSVQSIFYYYFSFYNHFMSGRIFIFFNRVNSNVVTIVIQFGNNFTVGYVPEPAQPTVAAPAPMNLAAESISRVTAVVWNDRTCGRRATGVVFWAANVWLWLMTALLNGRTNEPLIYIGRKEARSKEKKTMKNFVPVKSLLSKIDERTKFVKKKR